MVEELVDDLNSRLLQPEEAILTELVKKENLEMWVHRHSVRMSTASSGGALRWGSYGERTRWFADAARSPWRGVVIRPLTCVKMHGQRCARKSRSVVKCFQSYIRHDSHSAR